MGRGGKGESHVISRLSDTYFSLELCGKNSTEAGSNTGNFPVISVEVYEAIARTKKTDDQIYLLNLQVF